MAGPLANLASHGWGRVGAIVALFGVLGPAAAFAPFFVMVAIGGLAGGEAPGLSWGDFWFFYERGLLPAGLTGVAAPLLFPKGHQNTLPRVWAAAAIGTAGMVVAVLLFSWGPVRGSDLSALGLGAAVVLLVLALPAATLCWMIGRGLRLF